LIARCSWFVAVASNAQGNTGSAQQVVIPRIFANEPCAQAADCILDDQALCAVSMLPSTFDFLHHA